MFTCNHVRINVQRHIRIRLEVEVGLHGSSQTLLLSVIAMGNREGVRHRW